MVRAALLIAIAMIPAAMVAPQLRAQEPYPSRTIRLIVPFTPGTGADILARTLGQKIGEDWKASVIVENRPGASGNIGTEACREGLLRRIYAADPPRTRSS
jgi:tripartite-type tricarboxylate transporter receptor subunit TctC